MIKENDKSFVSFSPNCTDNMEEDQQLQNKIHELKHVNGFRLDNSFNGIQASKHVMYKLDSLSIGEYTYEFLVEYKMGDTCTGIYYGCKVLRQSIVDVMQVTSLEEDDRLRIANTQTTELVERAKHEFHELSGALKTVLYNSFPGKNLDKRLQKTDNHSNGTYWPFWIGLNMDEDICAIGGEAVKLIRKVYEAYLSSYDGHQMILRYNEFDHYELNDWGKSNMQRAFTKENYESLEKECKRNSIDLKNILQTNVQSSILEKSELYECAWIIKNGTLCNFVVNFMNNDGAIYKKIAYVFLDADGHLIPMERIKKQLNREKRHL